MKWDKYMRLAQGEKVLDNPQLLRKAVKKEAKEKAKKAAAWQARNSATAEKQQAAQQRCAPCAPVLGLALPRACARGAVLVPMCFVCDRVRRARGGARGKLNASETNSSPPRCRRQANLQKRVDSKKAGKVAKREKKLLRPGFEGRTERLPKMPGS